MIRCFIERMHNKLHYRIRKPHQYHAERHIENCFFGIVELFLITISDKNIKSGPDNINHPNK